MDQKQLNKISKLCSLLITIDTLLHQNYSAPLLSHFIRSLAVTNSRHHKQARHVLFCPLQAMHAAPISGHLWAVIMRVAPPRSLRTPSP